MRRLYPRWRTVLERGPEPETIGDITTTLGGAADFDIRHTGRSTCRGGADAARQAGAGRKVIAVHGA
ncbi:MULTISPECIES: hypothetical protein [unclassified Streptomyces]|uniref:hypothetical protein n=1 Tax=unclassified Streptomyces TaxID=2593676 RepID=UPI00332FA338